MHTPHFASFRAMAAVELRNAGRLRRDAMAGLLPRGPAISAIRDCLRHARALVKSVRIQGQI